MATHFCGKRHWEPQKGLLSQIHDSNLPVATCEDFKESLSDSFGLMLQSQPLGKVLDESQVQKLAFFSDTNIPYVVFCSTLKDLLITKGDWIFTVPSSYGKGTTDEVVEELTKRKKLRQSITQEEDPKEWPSMSEILGDKTKKSTSVTSNTTNSGSRIKHALQMGTSRNKGGKLSNKQVNDMDNDSDDNDGVRITITRALQVGTSKKKGVKPRKRQVNDRDSDSDDNDLFDSDENGFAANEDKDSGKLTVNSIITTPSSFQESKRHTSSLSDTSRHQSPQQESVQPITKNKIGATSTSSSNSGKYEPTKKKKKRHTYFNFIMHIINKVLST